MPPISSLPSCALRDGGSCNKSESITSIPVSQEVADTLLTLAKFTESYMMMLYAGLSIIAFPSL
jgi:hypothetical protein